MIIDTDTEVGGHVDLIERSIERLEERSQSKGFSADMATAVGDLEGSLATFKDMWAEERRSRGNI